MLTKLFVGIIVCATLAPGHPASAGPSPVVAGALSTFIPGAGQMYAGQTATGVAFFGGETILVAGLVVSVEQSVNDAFSGILGGQPRGNSSLGNLAGPLFLTLVGVHIWNIGNAVNAAGHSAAPPTRLNSFLSRTLSLLGPEDNSSRFHLGFTSVGAYSTATRLRLSFGFSFH